MGMYEAQDELRDAAGFTAYTQARKTAVTTADSGRANIACCLADKLPDGHEKQ